MTEFLRSFVSSHLRRFESNAQFPVIEFLALLYKYTFQQVRIESFFACLETWGVCLEFISSSVKEAKSKTEELAALERYIKSSLS